MGNNVANTDISASGAISGVTTLTLANVGGTATLSADVDVTTLSVNNTVANVVFSGNGSSVTNAVSFANDGTLTLGTSGGTQTYNGGLTTTSVGGTVTLNGTIASSDDAITLGAFKIGSTTNIDTNSTTTNRADITIAAVTGGNNTLTLTTENNVTGTDITASGAISGVTTLTLASVGGTATLSADVNVTTLVVDNTVANVAFTGNGSSVVNAVAFANDGTLALGPAEGTITFNGGLTTTSVGGTVTLGSGLSFSGSPLVITTSNDAIVLGAVTLGTATVIDTNATNGTGDITVALPKVTAPSTTASSALAIVRFKVTVPPTDVVVKPPL